MSEQAKSSRARRTEKVKVSIKQVKEWLEEGKDRTQIAGLLGMNFAETKALFQHPELKGSKVRKNLFDSFIIEDADPIPEDVQKNFMEKYNKKNPHEEAESAATAQVAPAQEETQPEEVAVTQGAW